MSSSNPKRVIYENLAEIAKAMGHEHRLELLECMAQGPQSVEQLATSCGLTVANTSRHLQLLRRARLVSNMRQGKQVFYALADCAEVIPLLNAMGRMAERNVLEMQGVMSDYLCDRDALEAVSREELMARLKDGMVTLLDVRSPGEFALGHIPGALNMPVDELERRLAQLPKDQEIVAYCRGTYCVLSNEAVAALRAKGYHIRRLEDGFPEWKAAGLAVATV